MSYYQVMSESAWKEQFAHLTSILSVIGANKNLFMKLIDALPVGVSFATDTSCEEVLHNQKAAEFLRVAPWESFSFSGTGPQRMRLFHQGNELAPEAMPLQRAARHGDEITGFEIEFVWPDNVRKTSLWSAVPLFDYRGRLIGATAYFEDITARRRLEADLRREHRLLETFVEQAVGCFAYLQSVRDEAGVIKDFRFAYINNTACLEHNLNKATITGKATLRLLRHKIRWSKHFDLFRRVVETGTPLMDELIISSEAPDNNFVLAYDVRAVRLGDGLTVEWRDVTKKKKAEESLRGSQACFRNVFHHSPDMMAILDMNEKCIEINQRLLDALGYTRDEVLGRTPDELGLWAAEDDNRLRRLMTYLLRQGEFVNEELKFRAKSGEVLTTLLSAAVIDLDGQQCLLAILKDITERKRIKAQMANLERLNLIGQMAAGISHEIRNPMTTVRGFLQFLSGKNEHAVHNRYFNLMIEELDRANAIITEFLSLARNKPADLRLSSLKTLVRAIFPLMQADAMKQEKFIETVLEDVPEVLLNEKEFRQLLLNLVRNGLEATPPGGKITVKTYADGEAVVLAVRDEGNGIPPEVLRQIGTPFFTTKENGTGLGLATCYSIAGRHNAKIEIANSPSGATFAVRFPLNENPALDTK